MKKGILSIFSMGTGIVAGAAAMKIFTRMHENGDNEDSKYKKFKAYYNMLNQWLMLEHAGISLREYFNEHGYSTVAIYGFGEMGSRLYEELKGTDICVKYAVDKSFDKIASDLKIISKDDDFDDANVLVVTAIFDFDKIEKEAQDKFGGAIVSLDDLIYELAIEKHSMFSA